MCFVFVSIEKKTRVFFFFFFEKESRAAHGGKRFTTKTTTTTTKVHLFITHSMPALTKRSLATRLARLEKKLGVDISRDDDDIEEEDALKKRGANRSEKHQVVERRARNARLWTLRGWTRIRLVRYVHASLDEVYHWNCTFCQLWNHAVAD